MFLVSLFVLTLSLAFFSILFPFSALNRLLASFGVAVIAALVEGVSPLGLDNLTVPASGVVTFILLGGGS
jgi:hypothetical protein